MADIEWKEPLSSGYYPLGDSQIAAIVTFLEMRHRPSRNAATHPALTYHRFGINDGASYRTLWRAIGEPWGWFSRLAWSDELLSAHLSNPSIEAYAVMQAEEPIGLIELDARAATETELAFFGVLASRIGQGFAAAMIEFAMTRAFARPIARFFVHTCTLDHPSALRFYEKAGFCAYRRAVEIATDPRAAGLLPGNAFPHFPRL